MEGSDLPATERDCAGDSHGIGGVALDQVSSSCSEALTGIFRITTPSEDCSPASKVMSGHTPNTDLTYEGALSWLDLLCYFHASARN